MNAMFEYVCGECEAILAPSEIMPHRKGHDTVAVTVTRRDIYEAKHGEVERTGDDGADR